MRSVPVLAAAALGAAAVVAAFVGIIVIASDEEGSGSPVTPSAVATEVPARLGVAVDLRSGPSSRVAIAARLGSGTEVTVEGRDDSGEWLRVRVSNDSDLVGWVPRNVVLGAPRLADLAVLASTPTATAVPTTTTPADLPDLVVRSAESRENRLVVTLANEGATDVTGTILLALSEAEAVPVDIKAGEPLIAGETLELTYEEEYVQRRGRVVITVSVEPPIEELSAANNRLNVVIEPDLENDLAILNAGIFPGRGLVVTVRNNSPIPIVGPISIDVHLLPEDTLLSRRRLEVELVVDGTIEVAFDAIVELDFTRARIELSSDALDDAQFANNTFPR